MVPRTVREHISNMLPSDLHSSQEVLRLEVEQHFHQPRSSVTKKRPQKRVFREKLTLVVSSGHKPTQTRLDQLHIVSCENVSNPRAIQQNLANKSTFLDGQTLLRT